LVAALVQERFGFLSDEAGAIELHSGLLQPWPRPLGLRHGSRTLARFATVFAGENEDTTLRTEPHIGIDWIRPGAIAGPCRVRHVFDHRYSPGEPARLEPLSRATGLVRIGSAAPRLRHEGRRGLTVLADLMQGASAHQLVSGDLEQSIRLIREQVEP
jgi:hypothetical protein